MSHHQEGRDRRVPALPGAWASVLLVAGMAMAACGVTAQVPAPPAPQVATPAPSPSADGSSSAAHTVPAPSVRPPQALPETEAGQTAYPELEASRPVEVRLPSIGVTSRLHSLGLSPDGTLQVPTGALVDQAAWYSGSPTPGEPGPTVVEGHVTGPGGRPSVFFALGEVATGDRIEVDREDGRTVAYEVYRVERFAKDDFPTVAVYGPTEGPELRVITCGGAFDEAVGHHVDNVVVFARVLSPGG
ncbi:class F sortase [Ornithinimicrobium tianjinense]|uniref:Class F sortase n=1 Tax=Ornithinimicrobium tianjinense TaxID=1195761 RepID=A0A917BII1_9MICO|nr:class F sortase [Ornithinimicrobium tianjinense]GGF45363.1 class F sortase [Ornithinimicrobium tianjinense]